MLKIKSGQNLKTLIMLVSAVVILITGSIMFITGSKSFVINGIKKDNGRVEITTENSFIYMFKSNKNEMAPVTNTRLFIEETADDTLIFYTTTNFFKLSKFQTGLSDDDLKLLNDTLNVFIEEDSLREYNNTYSFSGASGYLGLILVIISVVTIIINFRSVQWKNIFENVTAAAKTVSVKKIVNKAPKINTPKVKELTSGEKIVKILIPAYDASIKFDADIFRIPDLHSIVLGCTTRQKFELEKQFGDKFDYIICDDITGTGEMLLRVKDSLKEFSGYLIIQTDNLTGINPSIVNKLYLEHKNAYNECTILTEDIGESSAVKGKIIRNIAHRIQKISENTGDALDITEIYSGLLCFSTRKIFEMLDKLKIGKTDEKIPLTRIIEPYYRNNSKISSFVYKKSGPGKNISAESNVYSPKSPEAKKAAAIIISSSEFDVARTKNLIQAVTMPEVEKIFSIINPADQDKYKELFGSESESVQSDGSLGDGYDVLETYNILRSFKGNVIVIPESEIEISKDMILKLYSEHTEQNNICSYAKAGGNIILYCVSSDYFFYAAKKIIRDDETKKYILEGIIEILVNDKKKVELIEI